MHQTEQVTSITPLEATAKAIFSLQKQVAEQNKRIKQLEARAILNEDKDQRLQVVANAAVINDHSERIKKLETALRDIASCLTTSKVSEAIQTASGGHSHLILDAESVQIVGKACHRLAE